MAEEYSFGKNRIFYRSFNFVGDLLVRVDLLSPNLYNYADIELTEVKDTRNKGIYYFDYNFNLEGVWVGTFYESIDESGNKRITTQYFRIKKDSSGGLISFGSNRVINR